MLWVVSRELWVPAELSSQVGHTAWEDQLGAAASNVAGVIKLSASTLPCSHQPVLGRQPLLLWWLQLGLLPVGSDCCQCVRNVGFWGRFKGTVGLPLC